MYHEWERILRQLDRDLALAKVHPEWLSLVTEALQVMDSEYLESLSQSNTWLPGMRNVLSAFSRPLNEAKYILLGESPYPRALSANGYAFWDASILSLWSEKGLSTGVNRATSLRNLVKMLLHAKGDLQHDFSQTAIAALDKSQYVKTVPDLFQALLQQGFVLLNASLVFESKRVSYHAKHWRPFMSYLLERVSEQRSAIQLILLGKIAQKIPVRNFFSCFEAEHPYQLSFMTNPDVISFFKPFKLLERVL